MIKILLISHSSSKSGGGEDDFYRLLKYLHEKYYIVLITPDGLRKYEYITLSDDYLILPNEIFPSSKFNIKSYIRFIIVSIYKLYLIFKFLINKKIDICYINSSVCFVEAIPLIFFRIPYLLSIKENINPYLIRKIIYKFYSYSASKIIAVSNYLRNEFLKVTGSNDAEVIYIAIDEEEYDNYMRKSVQMLEKEDEFIILNIGSIYPLKSQHVLIESVKYLKDEKDIRIKIIGMNVNDEYKNYLSDKIKKIGNECLIQLLGEIDRKDLVSELIKSDCLVITSKEEGMPVVLLEGFFFELPIITTNVGLVPEIIKNYENGIIYEYGNSKKLAEKIIELKQNTKLYNQIKKNSRITYEKHFNIERSLKSYENEMLKMIN